MKAKLMFLTNKKMRELRLASCIQFLFLRVLTPKATTEPLEIALGLQSQLAMSAVK
jgi:hypothetical protein